jgi:hypothetical protein
MAKKNFKIDVYIESSDVLTDLDLREELKKRLQLNIIDGELYDRVIYAFENNLSVSNLFAKNYELQKDMNILTKYSHKLHQEINDWSVDIKNVNELYDILQKIKTNYGLL